MLAGRTGHRGRTSGGCAEPDVLFSNASEASTAATLLLALLAVLATMLVSPGTHPLASRLLWGARILIAIDSVVVLWAVGSLLLHIFSQPSPFPDKRRVVGAVRAICALRCRADRLQAPPRGPQETMAKDNKDRQKKKEVSLPESQISGS